MFECSKYYPKNALVCPWISRAVHIQLVYSIPIFIRKMRNVLCEAHFTDHMHVQYNTAGYPFIARAITVRSIIRNLRSAVFGYPKTAQYPKSAHNMDTAQFLDTSSIRNLRTQFSDRVRKFKNYYALHVYPKTAQSNLRILRTAR